MASTSRSALTLLRLYAPIPSPSARGWSRRGAAVRELQGRDAAGVDDALDAGVERLLHDGRVPSTLLRWISSGSRVQSR